MDKDNDCSFSSASYGVHWSTTTFSDVADVLAVDLQNLSAHLQDCRGRTSPHQRIRAWSRWVIRMVRVRLMTCLLLLLVLGLIFSTTWSLAL